MKEAKQWLGKEIILSYISLIWYLNALILIINIQHVQEMFINTHLGISTVIHWEDWWQMTTLLQLLTRGSKLQRQLVPFELNLSSIASR